MKTTLVVILFTMLAFSARAQVTVIAGDHKVVNIGDNGIGDFVRSVILLHEVYSGSLIAHNFVVGTITAMRGNQAALNRINCVLVNTSSAYSQTSGSMTAYDDYSGIWALKTCIYQGKKYLALDVPYAASFHNWGYQFIGSTKSSGESLKSVAYQVNGQPYNQTLISSIQDFVPNMVETHTVQHMSITGNLGLGVATPTERLAVNGNIRAREIKVETSGWPDYVFSKDYHLLSLDSTAQHIKNEGHLPGIPSAEEVKENGINLGQMNGLLLKKIEELTLYMLDFQRETRELKAQLNKVQQAEDRVK